MVIVFGALLGHILLSALFTVQAWLCRWSDQCLALEVFEDADAAAEPEGTESDA